MCLAANSTIELHTFEYHIVRIKVRHATARASDTERPYIHLWLGVIRFVIYSHITAWGKFDNFHDVLHVIKYLFLVFT